MIPFDAITEWAVKRPWPTRDQVEQDLLLSRAICEIAMHPVLQDELVFRGGTALHKLHLASPVRYSEDLDYVRRAAGGIEPVTRALTELGSRLGFGVSTRLSQQPKVYWRTVAESGSSLKIKIEIATGERTPALPLLQLPYDVRSRWWTGSANVTTFQVEELVATKIRALYQRRKGRDVFDLWLALERLALDPSRILDAFAPYRPDNLTASSAIANLRQKLAHEGFREDLLPLLREAPADYDIERAAGLIIDKLLANLDHWGNDRSGA